MSEYRPTLHPDFFTPAYNISEAFDEVEEVDDGGDGANAVGAGECEAFDGDEEVDEEADEANAAGAGKSNKIYTKQLRGGRHPIDFNVSSEINKKILKKETWIKNDRKPRMTEVEKNPSVKFGSANINLVDVIGIIDTADRPGDAYTEDTYA